jgi:short-subunit dehydrogenase
MSQIKRRPSGKPTSLTFRTFLALSAGKAAARATQLAGRGGGTAVTGAGARRIDPQILRKIVLDRGEPVIAITGSNGKTTTARFTAALLRGTGLTVSHNSAGANLVLSARRVPELEVLAAELRKGVTTVEVVPGDLSSPAGADAVATAAGRVDVLVNNAGVELAGRPWKDGLADKGDHLLQVNLLSPLRLTNRLLGAMVERGDGAVVFISSVSAWSPLPGGSYYAASKAALGAAANTMRIDLKGTGVHVLGVYPGPIHTPMLEKTKGDEQMRKFFSRLPTGRSDELAKKVVDALVDDHDTVVYPALYRPAQWLSPMSRWVVDRMTPKPKPKKAE